ncbi:ExeM/NucH family extracellular endonuclease [Zhihengliuella flava]|uniref:Extracellular nuclease n=1 Tax=Zhihengliuella flava TaxID=1285193 RepID=A0A931GFA3_9MICC|nr:putative extracellular nuclease [Zhihengliuella flava]
MHSLHLSRPAAVAAAAALGASLLVPTAAAADTEPDAAGVVINEAYLSGGSRDAAFTHKFVELFNPTDHAVSLDGWSLQYRSATGEADSHGLAELSGTIEPGGHFLISGGSNGTAGDQLPAADVTAGGAFNPSGSRGTIILAQTSERLSLPTGSIIGVENVADLLGYGSSNTFETEAADAPASNADPKSLNRTEGPDSDDNSADFSLSAAVTPTASTGDGGNGDGGDGEPDEPAQTVTIAEIQGEADATPLEGTDVVTHGVVTAAFPTGGLDGLFIQTPGTGADVESAASHGVFVYAPDATSDVAVGDYVEVSGYATEYYGLTQVNASDGTVEVLDEQVEPVTALTGAWPTDDADRERFESMLFQPASGFTVADNYSLNQYGEIGLAFGDSELVPGEPRLLQPTDVAPAGSDLAAQIAEENASRSILLDDGATADYMRNDAAKDSPLPYLDADQPIRVGAEVEFTAPVVLHYSFDEWRFQPQGQVTGAADEDVPVTFDNTREETPAEVGGDITLSSFNVLNYFPTTGEEFVAELGGTCSWYTDRDGEPVATNRCNPNGPRGAADSEDLERQEAKIVAAINALDADVVSLEEIENSAAFGKDRDFALATLTDALNEALGDDVWQYVPSPADVPADEDVIRTAFIYQKDAVKPIEESVILTDSAAFSNAREPLAQAFQAKRGNVQTRFVAIVNHFKSKGSDPADGSANADIGDGQGAWNQARVEQAEALVDFADELTDSRNTEKVFLTGDFNSYTHEDPMEVFYAAGYANLGSETEHTYLFDSLVGSLDHILASPEAAETVSGSTVWDINADEPIALEYSRYNYNVTDLYTADQYRASDHDPVLVGLELASGPPAAAPWEADATYRAGDTVSYDGATFEAQWYSRNQEPGANPYSAWAEQGEPVACAALETTAAAWTPSEVYTGGETVVHGGQAFTAQWYSRNQEPGQRHGPWELAGAC